MKIRTLFRAPFLVNCGYGQHARQLLKSLLKDPEFDLYLENIPWGNCSFLIEDTQEKNIIKNLIQKRFAAQQQNQENWDLFFHLSIPNEFERKARVNIGITAGIETDRVSHVWIQKVNEMDMVIVPSQHSKKVFDRTLFDWSNQQTGEKGVLKVQKPIVVCPEGVDTSIFKKTNEFDSLLNNLNIETDFNFLCVGQWGPGGFGEDRKNIALTVKWFIESFLGNKSVGLVLKTNTGRNNVNDCDNVVERLQQIKKNFDSNLVPAIYLIHSNFTDKEMSALYNHPKIKSFVSFTHGEGFGLPLVEAAACELPIIATDWSGHLDFLQRGNFSAVNYELRPIPDGAVWNDILIKDSKWAEVNPDDAIHRFRKMYKSHEKPQQWANELAVKIKENYSLDRIGSIFLDTVKDFLRASPVQLNPVQTLKSYVDTPDDYNVIYTMPMSAGDVFISSAVVDGLMKDLPENSKIYFATDPKYTPILLENKNIYKVIPWNQSMMNVDLLEEVFDLALTPNISTQLMLSNWVRRGQGRLLAEEFANHCNCELGEYFIKKDYSVVSNFDCMNSDIYMTFNPGSGEGQWEARKYLEWEEVLFNLKNLYPNLKIVQVGQKGQSERSFKQVDVDLRDCTTVNQLAAIIEKSCFHLSIDTFTMHLAAAFGVPTVALFGSSHAKSTGPWVKDKEKAKYILLEAENKMKCKKACYKYTCQKNKDSPCINEIDSFEVFQACYKLLKQYEEQGK